MKVLRDAAASQSPKKSGRSRQHWAATVPRQMHLERSGIYYSWLLHLPQVETALNTVWSTAKAQNSANSWGMCSKQCYALLTNLSGQINRVWNPPGKYRGLFACSSLKLELWA